MPQHLVYYKGPFDDVILTRISDFLRNKFPESPQVCHTLFAVFVELAQNISRYSAEHNHFGNYEDEHGVGSISIIQETDGYRLKASNYVEKGQADELIDRCNMINGLDYEGLKALRKQMRAYPMTDSQKGGNIGLIQVAMRSGQPLHVEIKPTEDDNLMQLVIYAKVPHDTYISA